jgi:hypothetical protein
VKRRAGRCWLPFRISLLGTAEEEQEDTDKSVTTTTTITKKSKTDPRLESDTTTCSERVVVSSQFSQKAFRSCPWRDQKG